jgi:hypothetical protein
MMTYSIFYYSLRIEIFVVIDFFFLQLCSFVLFKKKIAGTSYFVCYMFYCCMYFKLDLSFHMFAIIF